MKKKLELLSKKELIKIISKMKKKELIKIIENKKGGGEEVEREEIIFNAEKINKKNKNIAMQNDQLYNNIYI